VQVGLIMRGPAGGIAMLARIAFGLVILGSAVTGATVGARRPDQVDGVVRAAELKLTGDELGEIEAFLKQNP
jgi:aryl-alcohol dehydrogenase-like predicted oxidoreductase